MFRPALFLLLLLLAASSRAQTAVHHCVSANGTPVFTDQPCQSVQAERVGVPQSRPHHACPATREALRQRVADAFAAHDANALAGLMLWEGYSDAEAVHEVARMGHVMQRPLLGVRDQGDPPRPTASMPPAMDQTMPAAPASTYTVTQPRDELEVELGGVQEDGPLRFSIVVRAGCFWLRP